MNRVCSCATPSFTASTMFNFFLNFQNHRDHVTTTCESFIAIGWTVCAPIRGTHRKTHTESDFHIYYISKTTASMFTTTSESFVAIGWTVCAPIRHTHTHAHTHTHTLTHTSHTKTLIFIYRLNFQKHREHVYNNFWKLGRNRMNGVCSCRATPNTPASTIFQFFLISKITASMFTTISESFIAIGWTVRALVGKVQFRN